jgi:hypothetical protein
MTGLLPVVCCSIKNAKVVMFTEFNKEYSGGTN